MTWCCNDVLHKRFIFQQTGWKYLQKGYTRRMYSSWQTAKTTGFYITRHKLMYSTLIQNLITIIKLFTNTTKILLIWVRVTDQFCEQHDRKYIYHMIYKCMHKNTFIYVNAVCTYIFLEWFLVNFLLCTSFS